MGIIEGGTSTVDFEHLSLDAIYRRIEEIDQKILKLARKRTFVWNMERQRAQARDLHREARSLHAVLFARRGPDSQAKSPRDCAILGDSVPCGVCELHDVTPEKFAQQEGALADELRQRGFNR